MLITWRVGCKESCPCSIVYLSVVRHVVQLQRIWYGFVVRQCQSNTTASVLGEVAGSVELGIQQLEVPVDLCEKEIEQRPVSSIG